MKLKDPEVEKQYNELVKKLPTMSENEIEIEHKRLDNLEARFDEGVELAKQLCKLANSMRPKDQKRGFMLAMKREHRTLQQSAFQFFLNWAYFIAQEYKDYDIDLRNEAMVKTAKKLKECLGDYGDNLPFI